MPIQLSIKIRETKEGVRYQVRSPNAPNATKAEIGVATKVLSQIKGVLDAMMRASRDE